MLRILIWSLLLCLIMQSMNCAPAYDDPYQNGRPVDYDERTFNRRKKPCRNTKDLPPYGDEQGRTFFDIDFNFSEYNIQGLGQTPCVNQGVSGGSGLLGSHGGNGGGLLGSHGGGNGGGLLGSHGGSNGGGLLGSHGGSNGGGLLGSHTGNGGGLLSGLGGLLGGSGSPLGLGSLFGGNGNRPIADEPIKPVYENTEEYETFASPSFGPSRDFGSAFGAYAKNFNPNKVYRQVNRQLNKFLRPLYRLF